MKNSFHYDIIQITYINDNEELDIKGDLTDYDYIILDNFPNTNKHINLLDSIKALDIPVIFFEGHGFNPDYIQETLNIYHPNKFYIEDSKYQNESKISKNFNLDNDIDMGPVYSNYNLFSIDSLFTKIYYFSNNSVAAIISQNFSSFFIPNISEISFFMNTNYNSNYIEKYIEYILNTNSDDKELMNFKLKKNNYMIGENLLFKVNRDDIPFDILESKLIIKNLSTEKIDSLDYNNDANIYLNNSGEFETYFLFKGTNNNFINSNIESFYVNQENIELDNISQNVELLNNISSQSKGKYINAYNLDIDYFNSIDTDEIISDYKKTYTVLDLFIMEKIYLLVIILFSFEVYFRKRIGLL